MQTRSISLWPILWEISLLTYPLKFFKHLVYTILFFHHDDITQCFLSFFYFLFMFSFLVPSKYICKMSFFLIPRVHKLSFPKGNCTLSGSYCVENTDSFFWPAFVNIYHWVGKTFLCFCERISISIRNRNYWVKTWMQLSF